MCLARSPLSSCSGLALEVAASRSLHAPAAVLCSCLPPPPPSSFRGGALVSVIPPRGTGGNGDIAVLRKLLGHHDRCLAHKLLHPVPPSACSVVVVDSLDDHVLIAEPEIEMQAEVLSVCQGSGTNTCT